MTKKKLKLVSTGHPDDLQLLDEDGTPLLDGHITSFKYEWDVDTSSPRLTLELHGIGLEVEQEFHIETDVALVFTHKSMRDGAAYRLTDMKTTVCPAANANAAD
jgi:hypothetical protein